MGVHSAPEITTPVNRGTRTAPIAVISLYVGVKARREGKRRIERVTEEDRVTGKGYSM